MKHKLTQLLSLLLVLIMLFTLAPSALAEDGEDTGEDGQETSETEQSDDTSQDTGSEDDEEENPNELANPTGARDIVVTPPDDHRDGLVKFGDIVTIDGIQTTIADAMAQRCMETTGLALNYVAYLTIPATQGTLYDGYNAESDTGAGVAGIQKYYYNDPVSNYKLENIQFVPNVSFTGRAQISYYGYTVGSSPKIYAGYIYISVAKQVPGISYSTDGEAVRFGEEDFNAYSLAVTGRAFRYISFTLPDRLQGTLYYNYIDEDIYDSVVTADKRYYRRNNPTVDRVYFVPHPDYVGDVILDFSGVDISGSPLSGQVTVRVSGNGPNHTPRADGPFVYPVKSGRSVSPSDADFIRQCSIQLGQEFAHFTLTALPPASSGVLYDDGAEGVDHLAAVGVDYSTPKNLRFAANGNYTGVVSVPIVVTGADGGWFDSMLRFDVTKGDEGSKPLHYTVEPEHRAFFVESDFSDACYEATGFDIERIHFDSLPDSSKGALYYKGSIPVDSNANTFYHKGFLAELSFLATADFSGSVQIPFTGYAKGYSSSNGRSFTGKVTIASTVIAESDKVPIGGNSAGAVYYSTMGAAVQFDQHAIMDAANAALPGVPATIVLTRPEENAGTLRFDFLSLSRYTEFNASLPYPLSDISRVWFLPRAGFSGTVRIPYTVRDAGGNMYTGNINVTVTPPTRSAYFSDMESARWAVPAVDLFRGYDIVRGCTETSFAPSAGMRRCDFILLLSRAFSFPDAGTVSFADVPPGSYYAGAIASAKSLGIVTGGTDSNFDPLSPITRQEAAVCLYRALRRVETLTPGTEDDVMWFSDYEELSSYALEAMSTLVRRGIFNGDSNGLLAPRRTLTRAETVAILYRALT